MRRSHIIACLLDRSDREVISKRRGSGLLARYDSDAQAILRHPPTAPASGLEVNGAG